MNYKWENQDQRLLRLMRIPPKKKLEWLRQMNEFIAKCSSKQMILIRQKLRKIR